MCEMLQFPQSRVVRNQAPEIGVTEKLALDEQTRTIAAFTKTVRENGSDALVRKWSRVLDELSNEMADECLMRTKLECGEQP